MKEKFQPFYGDSHTSLNSEEALTLAKELKAKLQKGEKPEADKAHIKQIIAGLGDSRGLLRRTFSESLGLIGKAALPDLQAALAFSENVTLRRAAAKTLKLIGDPTALPDLLQALLNDKDPVVQGSSAGAMAIFGEKAVGPLVEVLKNPNTTAMQQGLASWGLAFVGAEAPQALKEAAKSNCPRVRASAIAALGEQIQSLNDKDAKDLLTDALDDSSIEVQIEAIKLIGILNENKWNLKLLCSKLESKEQEVRKQTYLSLMKLNAISQIRNLEKNLSIETESDIIRVLELCIKKLKSNQAN